MYVCFTTPGLCTDSYQVTLSSALSGAMQLLVGLLTLITLGAGTEDSFVEQLVAKSTDTGSAETVVASASKDVDAASFFLPYRHFGSHSTDLFGKEVFFKVMSPTFYRNSRKTKRTREFFFLCTMRL